MNCSTFAINSKCISCDVFFSSGYAAFIHHSMLFKCIFWSTCCSSFYLITAQYNKMKQRHVKKWTGHSKLTINMYLGRTQNSLYLYRDPNFWFLFKFLKKSDVCIAEDMTHFDTWVNLVNSVPHTILSFSKD